MKEAKNVSSDFGTSTKDADPAVKSRFANESGYTETEALTAFVPA